MVEKRILVVEDDPSIRKIITLSLKSAGFTDITQVDSGDAALIAAARTRPDLVLLDIMLPGIDGIAVCRMLY